MSGAVLRRRAALALAPGALLAAAAPPARAQDAPRGWPGRPVRLIVPYAPGGTTDIVGRHYADFLRGRLGQPMVVENRAGAATNVGAELVARAEPDGTTLLLGAGLLVGNVVWGPKPAFDPLTAFDAVGLIAETSYLICAGPRFAARSLEELAAAARRAPRRHTVATAQLDVLVAQLSRAVGIELEHVGYRGGAPAMMDAIAGQVDMVVALVPVLLPAVREGRLRALAATGPERPAVLPEVPTLRESGYPAGVQTSWNGVLAPAGTPPAVIGRLSAESRAFAADPDVAARLREQGIEPLASPPEDLARRLRAELEEHMATARALGVGVAAPR